MRDDGKQQASVMAPYLIYEGDFMNIIELQHFFRLCEESDAAMEAGWTWAFPNTPFTLRTSIDNTNAIYCKAVRSHLSQPV
jgi:hypothetical protein